MYYSQDNQDRFLDEHIFKGHKNGTFMDIGAHDGVSYNNTLYFEQKHNWNGVNIEPLQHIYTKLLTNRPNNINLNCAVSNEEGLFDFYSNNGYTEMLSGLKNSYDPRHLERLERENSEKKSNTETIKVATRRVETICNEYEIKHINYLSIDVEGAEFDVIKSINFDTLFVDVIGFENNFDDNSIEIQQYLENKNFIMCGKTQDIFMINAQSKFLNK
jgi:FkbM family methyltransferase